MPAASCLFGEWARDEASTRLLIGPTAAPLICATSSYENPSTALRANLLLIPLTDAKGGSSNLTYSFLSRASYQSATLCSYHRRGAGHRPDGVMVALVNCAIAARVVCAALSPSRKSLSEKAV